MRTLPLRGGARVTVVAEEWGGALGVVTRGRVQLELRDGQLGPVLGRDAAFWLRGTGVRALRNPGRRTATVRIVTPGTVDTHRLRRLAGTGFVATLAAVSATTLAAALARAVGVERGASASGVRPPLPRARRRARSASRAPRGPNDDGPPARRPGAP